MSAQEESNDQQRSGEGTSAANATGVNWRWFLLIGLLAVALFALWYDYKVARPAVHQAYVQIAAKNDEINIAAVRRRMTSVDVQDALRRAPSDTFLTGKYTVEVYRWSAGMPIEFRGLRGDESPGIGLKTHDYYAVYRKDGADLAFVTHFEFDLRLDELAEPLSLAAVDDTGIDERAILGTERTGDNAPPGGGPAGGFDPEVFFADRDVDGDGKLNGEEISERMRGTLEIVDTDEDGAISKEEFVNARRQGRGGSDGEGTARRRRPPIEDSDDAPASEAAAEKESSSES